MMDLILSRKEFVDEVKGRPVIWFTFLALFVVGGNFGNIYNSEASNLSAREKNRAKHSDAFEGVYRRNVWSEGDESTYKLDYYSGSGSIPKNVPMYLKLLQDIFNDNRFMTIVDLGCGDFKLMEKISVPPKKSYKGFDVVDGLIKRNQKQYTKKNIKFYYIEDLKDFKGQKADLLIIKDVMQHWSNRDIKYFLDNILPNFRYALITNDTQKDLSKQANVDISNGGHRLLDITRSPFNVNKKNLKELKTGDTLNKVTYLYTNPNNRDSSN